MMTISNLCSGQKRWRNLVGGVGALPQSFFSTKNSVLVRVEEGQIKKIRVSRGKGWYVY
jgi:hypothetical protein